MSVLRNHHVVISTILSKTFESNQAGPESDGIVSQRRRCSRVCFSDRTRWPIGPRVTHPARVILIAVARNVRTTRIVIHKPPYWALNNFCMLCMMMKSQMLHYTHMPRIKYQSFGVKQFHH